MTRRSGAEPERPTTWLTAVQLRTAALAIDRVDQNGMSWNVGTAELRSDQGR
jgi:hypothetical protein